MNRDILSLHDAANLVVYTNKEALNDQQPLNRDALVPEDSSLGNAIMVVVDYTAPPRLKKQRLEDLRETEKPSWISLGAWQAFLSSPGLKMDERPFFRALLTAEVVRVTSLDDLPISKCSEDKIHTYIDESTNVQVVCLPYTFPRSRLLKSHVLFIRPFHVDFIKAMIECPHRCIVVVGNSGIGKSFLQLVLLLWWARPELRLDPSMETFFNSIRVIARLERGRKTDVFFRNEQLHFEITHQGCPQLWDLDSEFTMGLYEPGVSKDEIEDCGLTDGYVWATVSPLESRYKQFSKTDCAKMYIGCASEEELMFMATVLDKGIEDSSELKPLYTPESVHERIQKLGPFQRVVLPTGTAILTMEGQRSEMVMANLDVKESLRACNTSDGNTIAELSRSRFVLRIEPNVAKHYTSYTLKPASDLAKENLTEGLLNMDIGLIHSHLTRYNDDPTSRFISHATRGLIPALLEVYFVKGVDETNTFGWKAWKVTRDAASHDKDYSSQNFALHVTRIDRTKSPTYDQIVNSPNTLFYMNNASFPLVDCFWYHPASENVNAGQISKTFSPLNTIHGIEAMKKQLQTPASGKIVINVVLLPRQVDQYMKCLTEFIDESPANVEFKVVRADLS
ncbi:hypothetical protein LEN26_017254 [Aphanomyces euteiches]|nr:hypothetical protein LEN26_017254 [Aphanomyces euteiches]KAH9113129.1 hypothetical protein AeMF1_012632 [Aphanomyces euteiches]KAH9186545.1 hypothetical protein AeNC1_011482 [Aphanomyces euteiches]